MIARLTRNSGLKLLALGIAFGLWVLVSGEQESVRVFTVPIDYQLAPDRMLTEQAPGTVQVRVKGSESILRGLAAEDLSVPVDLRALSPDRQTTVRISAGSVQGVPSGAAVEIVTPDRVSLTVEAKAIRVVPVVARFEGSPAPGHHLAGFSVTPREVTIEGPATDVEQISSVSTEPIPLHGREVGLTVLRGPLTGNPRVRVIEVRLVSVTVQIAEDTVSR